MIIKLTKRLLALVLIFTLIFSSRVAVAAADNFFSYKTAISSTYRQENPQMKTFSHDDLTPQERQEIQAVRQRRNKEIAGILNLSQRQELKHQLHANNNLEQSLSAINLSLEQKELLKAIVEVANLKIKSIISRHAMLQGNR